MNLIPMKTICKRIIRGNYDDKENKVGTELLSVSVAELVRQ